MIDFQRIAADLLREARDLLPQWLPGGKFIGNEYTCANIDGGRGQSFKVNIDSGKWAEFSGDLKGGDLLSLFAAIKSVKQSEAARILGFDVPAAKKNGKPILPPPQESTPALWHAQYGKPSKIWRYNDVRGRLLFYVARYDPVGGRKQIIPWRWENQVWQAEAMPKPRPLYALDRLATEKTKPVLIVEGEKAADAAAALTDEYVVTTWPGGAQSVSSADWSPLKGRRVLIWPDADAAGAKAAATVFCELMTICPEVKVVNVQGQPEAWDAADAQNDGWTPSRAKEWLMPRITINLPDADLEPSKKLAILWNKMDLTLTASGHPIPNLDNATKAIEHYPKANGMIFYDEFKGKYFSQKGHEWTDQDTYASAIFLQSELGMSRLGDDITYKALTSFAHKNPRNEPRDWMETLKWDGEERISRFMSICMGADENEYITAASRNFWISLVARVYRPGCRCDNMVVLEGEQGLGKTEALRAIGGPWYTDMHYSLTDKDFYGSLRGALLVEIAELDSFSRVEVTRIKQVVTCTIDRYREPYARVAQDFPRRCVFVGTTNEQDYLKDPTGGRRFWPILCRDIEVDFIRESREQLFAEAVMAFKRGEPWHLMPKEATINVQETRRRIDAWESVIEEFLQGRSEITIRDLAADCLKIHISQIDMLTQKRIGTILRQLKWGKKVTNLGKKVWIPLKKNHKYALY